MSGKDIRRYTAEELENMEDLTDWERLKAEGDYEGPAEFEVNWSKVRVVIPEPKTQLTLRLDADVLDFFKAQGKGYQTRINAVLRAYMEAQEGR